MGTIVEYKKSNKHMYHQKNDPVIMIPEENPVRQL